MFDYFVENHFWFVGGDRTQVYSSARKEYVPVTDPVFQNWLAGGRFPTTILSEGELREVFAQQYPEGWPVDYQRVLISEALGFTDVVANRCFKAGVAFPPDWVAYVNELRQAYRADQVVEIPPAPKNEDGSIAYPAGT